MLKKGSSNIKVECITDVEEEGDLNTLRAGDADLRF